MSQPNSLVPPVAAAAAASPANASGLIKGVYTIPLKTFGDTRGFFFETFRRSWIPEVLFMELIVDERGAPASRLVDFSFTPEVAAGLHQEIFLQVKTLLSTGRVHGDLSAYNLLMAGKGLTMIDLPQAWLVQLKR